MTWSQLAQLERLLSEGEPKSAYLFPEIPGANDFGVAKKGDDLFVFQFWPETLDATYTVNYAQKAVVGGSHDLQQWTGGSGRDITFSAVFTAELAGPDARPVRPGPLSVLAVPPARAFDGGPSARYSVDVRGAVSQLQSFMLGSYGKGQAHGINNLVSPPKKLWLVLENTGLGGNTDDVLVILRSAPVTYESWFPNGKPRIVVVACTFTEIVQRTGGQNKSSDIQFIGREVFERDGEFYKFRGVVDRTI